MFAFFSHVLAHIDEQSNRRVFFVFTGCCLLSGCVLYGRVHIDGYSYGVGFMLAVGASIVTWATVIVLVKDKCAHRQL